MTLARVVLKLVGFLFVALGVWGLLSPVQFASMAEVQLATPTAITDGRAVYGGLELGIGTFLLLCANRQELVRSGLLAVLLIVGGLFVGRAMGLLLDASGSTVTYQALGIEFLCTALAVLALKAIS
jgi:hypothetical protein